MYWGGILWFWRQELGTYRPNELKGSEQESERYIRYLGRFLYCMICEMSVILISDYPF